MLGPESGIHAAAFNQRDHIVGRFHVSYVMAGMNLPGPKRKRSGSSSSSFGFETLVAHRPDRPKDLNPSATDTVRSLAPESFVKRQPSRTSTAASPHCSASLATPNPLQQVARISADFSAAHRNST